MRNFLPLDSKKINMKANEIGIVAKEHKRKTEVIECTEQSRFCLKKFIPTRVNQGTVCIKCLKTLELLDDHPIIKGKVKRNLWN